MLVLSLYLEFHVSTSVAGGIGLRTSYDSNERQEGRRFVLITNVSFLFLLPRFLFSKVITGAVLSFLHRPIPALFLCCPKEALEPDKSTL